MAGEKSPGGVGRGERAVDFVLPMDGAETQVRFYARAGGSPTGVIFYGPEGEGAVRACADALLKEGTGISVFGVRRSLEGQEMPFSVFVDAQGAVQKAYRLSEIETPVLFVLDKNLRVLASVAAEEGERAAKEALRVMEEVQDEVPLQIQTQAPVLLIPNVLEPEVCAFLKQVWETQGHRETGVERSEEGHRGEAIDYGNKSRTDHVVEDEKLLRMLSSAIGRRVMPEVQRAFAYRATRFEGFKIACYNASSGGFFHAHRDNLSPSTAHRRFALSLNLNDGYEGGFLRFPEFGPHLYRPGTGSAVVFACAHLHEVTAVTQGQRFALLSFLFADEGREKRE